MVKGELTGDDVTVVLLLPTDDARSPNVPPHWANGARASSVVSA